MYPKTDLIDGKGTAPQGAVVCGYQMETLSWGARYMPSPSVTPNVSMNFWNCWTVMLTRAPSGGWASMTMDEES